MDMPLLIARLLLAMVFVVAGLAKLADRAGSRQALIGFGVPAPLASPFGVLLPLAELAVVGALVSTVTAWWGALGALAFLLLFVAGIGVNLARGRTPDCHCFGQLHSAPAGWSTLARNVVLAGVAAFVAGQGSDAVGPSVLSWWSSLTTIQLVGLTGGVIVLGLLVAEGWLLIRLLGQNGRLLLRLEALETRLAGGLASRAAGLSLGAPAPAFHLSVLGGQTLTLDALRATGKPVLLVFFEPDCGPCTTLLPEIGRWQRDHAATLTIALVSRGTPEANRAKTAEHGVTHVLLQRDYEVAQAYQADGTPSAVIILPDATIGSRLAAGADEIRALVAQTAGAPTPVPTLMPGSAPTATATADRGNGASMAPIIPVTAMVGEPAPKVELQVDSPRDGCSGNDGSRA